MNELIKVFDSLESTNQTAKEFAKSGAEHGTVIIADSQTAGKGRYGRTFYSPPGHGIYMSMILNRPLSLATAFAAVSVCEAIEAVSEKRPQIKWVNDVFLDGKKIGGILTEAISGIPRIVIGIGINFSTPVMEFPEELRQTTGSLFPNGNATTTRNDLAAQMINRIVAPEKQTGEKEILEQYKKRLMMLGKTISVIAPNETYEALAVDIDEAGRLIVKKNTGEWQTLSAGEISVRM